MIKPDLVAPGDRLVGAAAKQNWLAANSPLPHVGETSNDDTKLMYLSGTSTAASLVTGAVALMLEANPKLTPNMIKMILQYTAQPLAGYNHFEQGVGQLNIEGAVRLARLIRTDLPANTPLGTDLLTTTNLPIAQTTVAGYGFNWAAGTTLKHRYATGTNLIAKYHRIFDLGVPASDGVLASDGTLNPLAVLMSGDDTVYMK